MTQRRIVVTGGAGFIGHHLVRRLLASDCHVLVVDSFVRGHIHYLPSHPRLSIAEVDIRDNRVREIIYAFTPDTIYHLAANHFIPDCIKDPVGTLGVNVLGTQNLLCVAEAQRVRHFIFASTADVYATSSEKHCEKSPLGSSNIYGVTKICAESLVRLAKANIPSTRFQIARLFNVYGPEETNAHVIPDIILGIKSEGKLRLGNLNPSRDYVFVADVVDALISLPAYRGTFTTFNIGTGIPTSVENIVRTIESILGRRLEIASDDTKSRNADRLSLVADAFRASQELNWQPAHSLQRGLRELLVAEGII